ncbi:MAG: protein-methionine-sulfoxide reductase heme-binding subunit MsrQ [Shewanella sp.]|nr:protein-methionine-sulfoxide reductase heme-binding subunit MsrQ [Shewanella sp.]MCF1429666.1 protein-methionine-sulfoxide reductase heme-binding subunit MsrQ [Shewanella sp.]MCF1437420.1 protein-methionine-sulfoxide reductase heme-binding subunit MsrQ [Shewanella sp.]MCF1456300.1 protein-methionine-sulfoxide reductase heme-binding subunit MsrQ [Shewanella sp.]
MAMTRTRLLWLKAVMHLAALVPLGWLCLAVLSGQLGAEPVERIIHFTGIGALNLLLITLCVSPLARFAKMGFLMQTRRLLGLYCFSYASLHILAYLALDLLFDLSLLVREVLDRPYIVVGAISYLILLALAITSVNKLRAKMGHSWQRLHNLIYLCAILIPLHFYWSLKSGWIEPAIYALILLVLLGLRKSVRQWLGLTRVNRT